MVDGQGGKSGIFFAGTDHAGGVMAAHGGGDGGGGGGEGAKRTKKGRARGKAKSGGAGASINEGGGGGSSSTGKKKGSSTGGQLKRAIQNRFSRKGSSSGGVGGAPATAPPSQPTLDTLPPSRRHSTGGVGNVNLPSQHMLHVQHGYNPAAEPIGSAMPTIEPVSLSMPTSMQPVSSLPMPMPMNNMSLPTPAMNVTSMMPTVPGGIPYDNTGGGMAGQDPAAAAPVFQAGMMGHAGGEHRRASLPTTAGGGSSSFPLELFEPRPLREDGRGFVDEQADDPAASAYYGAAPPPPPASGNDGSSNTADYTVPTKNDPLFQPEYGFMGINDVVKGHEEKAGAYRDRRSSWTSRDSRGSGSTFPNSGSKRGLTSDDGDSVGTNEFEPPRRRPSYNSSIASDDLDDLRALDLEQDDDDFGMDFAAGAPSAGGVAPPATHAQQPVLSYPAGTTASIDNTFAGAVAGGATANIASSNVASVPCIGDGVKRNDSNVSDSSLDKALQVLEDVMTADFAETVAGSNGGPLAG